MKRKKDRKLSEGEAETYAAKETQHEIAERLRWLELTDPQPRPTPKPSVLSKVAFYQFDNF